MSAPAASPIPEWVGKLALLLFAAGVAWGVTSYRLSEMSTKVDRIDQRVAEMYCASLPVDKRAGCR